MKKRILSLALLVCLLITAIPVFTFPVTAASADTAKSEKITVSFRLADSREGGINGTLVAERRVPVGFSTFALPSEVECYAAGIRPDDVLGWYSTDTRGVITDARAYLGTYLTDSLVFYPILKSSVFDLHGALNVPYFTKELTHKEGSTNYFTLLGLRGGFNVGAVGANAAFVGFSRVPSAWLADAGTNPWTYGGAYYSAYTTTSDNALVLSASSANTVGINWTAIASGKVTLDFRSATFINGGHGTTPVADPTAYIALLRNGEVIWPAGASYATTDFASKGWYRLSASATATAGRVSATVEGGLLKDLTVTGGDDYTLCIGYANIKPINLRFVATYTEVGEYSKKIVTELPAYTVPSVFSASQLPTLTSPSATDPEVTLDGLWDWITYPNYAAISSAQADEVAYYSPSGATKDAFLTSLKDYGSDTAVPFGFKYGLPDSGWGVKYNLCVQNNGSLVGIGGFRYTAEFTGHIDLAFASFLRSTLGWEQKTNNSRIAVFLDGKMIWPNAGADAADLANWYTPYPDGVSNGAAGAVNEDIAAALSAVMPQDVFVREGQKIDFLMTAVPSTNIWSGAGNYMEPAVTYRAAYVTDFSVRAALGERFALDFSADEGAACFVPSETRPYLRKDSFAIAVTGASDGMTVSEQKTEDGRITVKAEGIAARMLSDKLTYRVTATEKTPSGTESEILLSEGSISLADYLTEVAKSASAAVRDLANATLAYGRAAQKYFDYRTDALPTAGELSFTPAPAENVAAENGSGAYRFSGATLLLQDTLKLKFFIDATDAAITAPLYLAVEGSEERIPLLAREGSSGGSHLKGYIAVPCAKFGESYTVRVVDGEGRTVSSAFTYSVGSYIARMGSKSELAELLSSLNALGRAAKEYTLLTEPTPRGNTVSRVIILSDAHIGEALTNAADKLKDTLSQITAMGGADAILFTGDMTDNGFDKEYEQLISILKAETGAYDRVGFVLGNHEHYRNGYKTTANTDAEKKAVTEAFNKYMSEFHTEEFGFYTANNGLDHTLVLDGVYYIGLGERDCTGLYGAEVEEYLCEQVEAAADADPTKPIFVYSHIGYGAIKGDSKMTVSQETADFLKNYPQIVWITGHTHYASQDVYMIGQEDFTNIQAPTAGSKWWWYYSSYGSEDYQHDTAYAVEAQQGIIIDVTDTGVVIAQRYDFATGAPVGAEWVIDTPAILRSRENFTYTESGRLDAAAAPAWSADDRLTVSSVTSTGATVTLPRAHIADAVSDDTVTYYRLVAVDEDGNSVYSGRLMTEYYRGSAEAETYSFTLTGLEAGKTYRLYAVAESVFGLLSEALVGEVTTKS